MKIIKMNGKFGSLTFLRDCSFWRSQSLTPRCIPIGRYTIRGSNGDERARCAILLSELGDNDRGKRQIRYATI